MKRGFAMILCICLLCLSVLRVQGSSIIKVESIEDALTWESNEYRGSVCVVIGSVDERFATQNSGQTNKINVERVVYGDVEEVYLRKTNDINLEGSDPTPGILWLLLLQPVQHITDDGKTFVSDHYYRVGVHQGQFCFVDGKLRGVSHLVEEILTDDPTIDTMDELAGYFEKRIDALQREGKLPPDPVDWPGTIGAAGGIVVVLGGLTTALVWRRRKIT